MISEKLVSLLLLFQLKLKHVIMKLTQIFLLLCFSFSAYCQTYQFLPNWKVGEVKKVVIIDEFFKVQDENEVFIKRDTTAGPIFKVKEEFEDYFLLEVSREPQILEKIGKTLEGYDQIVMEEIPVVLRISKIDGNIVIENFDNLKSSLIYKKEVIDSLSKNRSENERLVYQNTFKLTLNFYKDVETFKSDFLFKYSYAFSPYQSEFKKHETIESKFISANPLRPDMMISILEYLKLDSIADNKMTAYFTSRDVYDLKDYNKELREMMEQTKGKLKEEGVQNGKSAYLPDLQNIGLETQTRLTFNLETNWVENAVSETFVKYSEQGKSTPSNKIVKTYWIE